MSQDTDAISILHDFIDGINPATVQAKLEACRVYTPYIAAVILDALKAPDPEGIIKNCSCIIQDLHHVEGYFLSADKFLEVDGRNGIRYRITVEDLHGSNAKPLTADERQLIRKALAAIEPDDPEVRKLIDRFRERR